MSGVPLRVRVVGAGRAGGSFAAALADVGCEVDGPVGREPSAIESAAEGVDVVLICVSDRAVAEVAAAVRRIPGVVVAHVSGSLGLEVLQSAGPGPVGSIHPLVSLPDPAIGAERLRDSAWFAVAGDETMEELVALLGGRSVHVADADRASYHAAACIAANHLVALMGQVERIANRIGVPLDAYVDLARGALDNVAQVGPAAALTGPAARGDQATLDAHLASLDASERPAYRAMSDQAQRLAAQR